MIQYLSKGSVNMEFKRPIKYAILKIKEKEEIVAYIISKCYVISEKEVYETSKIFYEVLFPYNAALECNMDSKYFKTCLVSQLFDDFKEAEKIREELNNKILYHEMSYVSIDKNYEENIEKLKKEHQEILEKYLKIEKEIQDKTTDMKITQNLTLEEIIKRIIKNPREFYIRVASILSIEEIEYLKQLIENKSCQNCTNENCHLEYNEKIGLDKMGNIHGSNCSEWTNPELIGRKRIMRKNI